jgi:hypothetical protein
MKIEVSHEGANSQTGVYTVTDWENSTRQWNIGVSSADAVPASQGGAEKFEKFQQAVNQILTVSKEQLVEAERESK